MRLTQPRAFTLVEVLVVIVILSVLAALIFPVFARARKSANISSDTAQMRQIYLAVKIYEEDSGEMPPDLSYLVPRYLPKEILHGAGDPRPRGQDGLYPRIMSCDEYADGVGNCPRSSYMVSYPYLKTFERRFPAGVTFSDLKNRPSVGLLTALHHADLFNAELRGTEEDPSRGILHDSGIFIRTRMDGSTKVLRWHPIGVSQDCSWEECFLW